MTKWFIHQDRDKEDPELMSYSISTKEGVQGWGTDSGYDGYGLPKELAQWICDVLNESGKECPYEVYPYGFWKKKPISMNELQTITPLQLPFNPDDKIFITTDEDGDSIGEPYSYNEWIEKIENISGVNEDLLGPSSKGKSDEK